MAGVMSSLFSSARRRVPPTKTIGVPGRAVYGGFVVDNETSSDLTGTKRYETFSEILADTSIAAAGVRYFLNLVSSAEWAFSPADGVPGAERYSEELERILTEDMDTPWRRVVRRAAMYRFYGFSVQEWTAMRRGDGVVSLADVAPRAQRTIERWDVDPATGRVRGMVQRSPQDMTELYLPREKTLYLTDDTLDDGPEGLGLFRHLAGPAKRLKRYEQLEGFGYDNDLRGVPVGRGPFTELAQMVKNGEISEAQRLEIEKPLSDFMEGHVRQANTGILLDSTPYQSDDEASTPSSVRQWDIDTLKSIGSNLSEVNQAIQRVNREIARVLGVEQLLLGENGGGSHALSRDKTQSLFLMVNSTLSDIEESMVKDLARTVFRLNGWPEEAMPAVATEEVRFTDVEEITAALRDMAQAGAVLEPDDEAIGEVRDLLGLSRPPKRMDGDEMLGTGGVPRTPGSMAGSDDVDVLPERGEDDAQP